MKVHVGVHSRTSYYRWTNNWILRPDGARHQGISLQACLHWYGLMVLPPAEAIHPSYGGGVIFGELGQNLLTGDVDAIHLARAKFDC